MSKKEDKNKVNILINDLKNNSQHKAWVFLAFYFIFFFFLILAIRSNSNSKNINNVNININANKYFSMETIKNNNYHFKYIVNSDGNETIYDGDRNNLKEKFTKTRNSLVEKYYQENNIYLKQINSNWINTNDPYEIITFRNIDDLNKIINSSTFISKTMLNDNSNIYDYQISTTTLYKILDFTDIDLDDLPNIIKVTTDSNNELVKLELNMSSYFKYKNMCNNSLNIVMEYSNFGKINDIIKN